MATSLQIPFGQRSDGRLVEVSQVDRGLACNCHCPACGERLLAKKGELNVQLFSHLPGSDCATGAETAIHLAAKQLVAEKRWLALPPLEVRVMLTDPECGLFAVSEVFGRNAAWHFDRVALELAMGAVRPDAVGFIGDAGSGVEIRVTHEVDSEKQAHLARLGLPSIEVDLAALVGKVRTFEALEAAVITGVENKRWLFHPRRAEWEALLLAGFDNWRRARMADLARLRSTPVRPPAAQPSLTDVYQAANAKYRVLPPHEKWARLERELGIEREAFPSHLRVAVREGGDVVLADKDLWQGAVFAQFVLRTGTEGKLGKRMPTERALSVWLAQRFGVKGGNDAARPAARSYMNYLKACGFLRWERFDFYVEHDQLAAPLRLQPAPPATQPRPEASVGCRAPSIRWLDGWPDDERLRQWAAEACMNGDGFDADCFVRWLLSLDEPPALADVQGAFAEADGNPDEVMDVLRSLGVVAGTRRYFTIGEAAPWAT